MRGKQKFGARKVKYDGIVFASKLEGDRYLFLRDLERNGEIQNLRMQVEYELLPRQSKQVTVTTVMKTKTKVEVKEKFLEHPVKYKCDFQYEYKGETITEDTKGSNKMASRDFPIRKKLMLYVHGIEVKVIKKATTPIEKLCTNS